MLVRKGLIAGSIAGVCLPLLAMSVSAATPATIGASQIVMLSPDHSNAVLIPLPGVAKASYAPAADARKLGVVSGRSAGPNTVTNGCGGECLTGSNSISTCPSGGSCSETTVNFSTSNAEPFCGLIEACYNMSGNSHTYWDGSNPYNATSMQLSDVWSVGGLAISVTIPGGVGISGSGDEASWNSGRIANTWQINHYFNGIDFSSDIYICCAAEQATGEAQFGSSFWTTTAHS